MRTRRHARLYARLRHLAALLLLLTLVQCGGEIQSEAEPPPAGDPGAVGGGPPGPGATVKYSGGADGAALRSTSRKMKANYVFSCPDQLEVNQAAAAELILSPALSVDELERLVDEEQLRFSGSTTVTPFVEARLETPDSEGILIKATTPARQQLLPDDQNRWTWQILGKKPNTYLLSVTVSLLPDAPGAAPIATPVAISRRVEVIVTSAGPPGGMALWIGAGAGIGAILLFLLVTHGLRKQRNRRWRDAAVLPGTGRTVFVSYSRKDAEIVDRVVEELEKAGHELWIDREGIDGAESWRGEIVEALSESRYVLFFASQASYASLNVEKELALAADEHKQILPILLEASEPTGGVRYVVAGLHRIEAAGKPPLAIAAEISRVLAKEMGEPDATPDPETAEPA